MHKSEGEEEKGGEKRGRAGTRKVKIKKKERGVRKKKGKKSERNKGKERKK